MSSVTYVDSARKTILLGANTVLRSRPRSILVVRVQPMDVYLSIFLPIDFVRDWNRYQELKDPELKDTPINFIKMHPSGRRLMVHARNNAIFMFDLRV